MTLSECYNQLGGDYAGACKRLMNEKLLGRFLQKFPDDPSMRLLMEAVKSENIENSFSSVHTLKGVAGNLGLTQLYQAAWNLTEQLRPRKEQADEQLLKVLVDEYHRTLSILGEWFAQID